MKKLNTLFNKLENNNIESLSIINPIFVIGNYKINAFVANSTSVGKAEQISFSITNFYKSVNIDRSILLRNFDPSEELKPFKKITKDSYNREKEVVYLKVPYEIFKTFITNLYNFYNTIKSSKYVEVKKEVETVKDKDPDTSNITISICIQIK